MKFIDIRIEGISPLLMHKFTDEAQLAATAGTRRSSNSGDRGTDAEQAAAHLYLAPDGETVIIPQPNLFACIMEAGKWHKAGRNKITTQKSSLIPGAVFFDEAWFPLDDGGNGWKVDTRPVRIPATGGRIQRHRPMFEQWAVDFIVQLDDAEIGLTLLRNIIDDAGSKVGLGDFRPATKGPFGRFKVTRWVVTNERPETVPLPLAAE